MPIFLIVLPMNQRAKTIWEVPPTYAIVVPLCLGATYLLSYLIWINYSATGCFFTGIFEKQFVHLGMSFGMHPSPPFLKTIYWPLMLIDAFCGRLVIGVG